MSFDWTTEILSHFIGLFEISEERARMRDDYDRFKKDQAEEQDAKFEAMGGSPLKASFKLDKFSPKVTHQPVRKTDLDNTVYLPSPSWGALYPVAGNVGLPFLQHGPYDGFGNGFSGTIYYTISPTMDLEPAGSVAIYTYQSSILVDNDVIAGNGTIQFQSVDDFSGQLSEYEYVANSLQSFEIKDFEINGLNTSDGTAVEIAISLHSAIATTQESGINGAAPEHTDLFTAFGTATSGLHINGELAEEAPYISDLLPTRLSSTSAEAEDTAEGVELINGNTTEGEGVVGIVGDAPAISTPTPTPPPSPYAVPDGHNVVMGGNFLINETYVGSNWLDAPVLAVMGNVHSINAINQVNVVADYDTGLPETETPAENTETDVLNVSQIDHITNPFAPGTGVIPTHWVVATIAADVVSTNWVEQFNFALDHDIAEVSFSGQNTFLQLGDNSLINAASLQEIGYGYDLIFIGGSIVNINAISQTNVLFDNDHISASDGTPGTITSSGNLVANFANITTVGVDSYSTTSDEMVQAADQIHSGYGTVHDAFAQLDAFNGVDLLRVLHIEGDLIQMNLISQTNILGDADQVHVALEGFLGNHDDVSVNTGENALLNVASTGTFGIDSEVYVSGEVYSDAMLVQANLIDTDADPLGVNLTSGDLATEAVAFLADDMMGATDFEYDDDLVIAPTALEDTAIPDSLQVMLA